MALTLKQFAQKPMANKVSSMFVGTRDKCLGCKNTVYPTEKVQLQNSSYKFMYQHLGITRSIM